jgi:PD-(D/E)XK nuclease superfamily
VTLCDLCGLLFKMFPASALSGRYSDRELKAVEKVLPIHKARLLSYMKLLNKPLSLLINFHELVLRNGIYRMILKGGDSL